EALTTPKRALEDDRFCWEELLLRHPKGEKQLRVKVVGPCCWYASAGQPALRGVLGRRPAGGGGDEGLVCGGARVAGGGGGPRVRGYRRRWRVGVASGDAKQRVGFHARRVGGAGSGDRAHGRGWPGGGLGVLWYARGGGHEPQARRHRPWYKDKASPTFA